MIVNCREVAHKISKFIIKLHKYLINRFKTIKKSQSSLKKLTKQIMVRWPLAFLHKQQAVEIKNKRKKPNNRRCTFSRLWKWTQVLSTLVNPRNPIPPSKTNYSAGTPSTARAGPLGNCPEGQTILLRCLGTKAMSSGRESEEIGEDYCNADFKWAWYKLVEVEILTFNITSI